MSHRSLGKLWRQDLNVTAKVNPRCLDSPAKDSGLDSEKLVDCSKQKNNIITVYFRKVTGWLLRGELKGELCKRTMRWLGRGQLRREVREPALRHCAWRGERFRQSRKSGITC